VTNAVAGIVYTFVVTLFDSGNNRLSIGGDTLQVIISPLQTNIEYFDNQDGSYLVMYKITQAGTFDLSVRTNLDSSNIKESKILVVPNNAASKTSTLSFVTPVTLNIQQTVLVDIFDDYKNRVI